LQRFKHFPTFVRTTDTRKEMANFALENNNERNGTHADKAVENGSHKSHFEHVGNEKPKDDERDNSDENVSRSGAFH
jgi:hypothetical protein